MERVEIRRPREISAIKLAYAAIMICQRINFTSETVLLLFEEGLFECHMQAPQSEPEFVYKIKCNDKLSLLLASYPPGACSHTILAVGQHCVGATFVVVLHSPHDSPINYANSVWMSERQRDGNANLNINLINCFEQIQFIAANFQPFHEWSLPQKIKTIIIKSLLFSIGGNGNQSEHFLLRLGWHGNVSLHF